MRSSVTAAIAAACFTVATAQAATLDFEGGPGYAPSDNQFVTSTTFNAFNISISGPGGSDPLSFEAVGSDDGAPGFTAGSGLPNGSEGFVSGDPAVTDPRPYDTERAGAASSLGGFFLRQTMAFSGPMSDPFFTISYLATPTGVISGEIWDIDSGDPSASEQWRVDLFGANSVLASETSPAGTTQDANSLDGDFWRFEFDPADFNEPIRGLDVVFIGGKTQNIGVAFDNFQTGTTVVPLPAALPMLVGALSALGYVSRRRRGLTRQA